MNERTGAKDTIDERAWIQEIRSRPAYRGRRWDEVEPDVRREWTTRHPDRPWDDFLDRAQELWDDLTEEPGVSVHRGEEPR